MNIVTRSKFMNTLSKRILTVIISSMVVIGCNKAKDNKSNNGGVDGSGGDTVKISIEKFKSEYSRLPTVLPTIKSRLELMVQRNDIDNSFVVRFIDLLNKSRLDQSLSKLNWHLENDYCFGDGEKRAASADLNTNTICISYKPFSQMSESEFETQLRAISLHELSHLVGFNEEEAVKLQDFLFNSLSWVLNEYPQSLFYYADNDIEMATLLVLEIEKAYADNNKTELCTTISPEITIEWSRASRTFSTIISLPSISSDLFHNGFFDNLDKKVKSICKSSESLNANQFHDLFDESWAFIYNSYAYIHQLEVPICKDNKPWLDSCNYITTLLMGDKNILDLKLKQINSNLEYKKIENSDVYCKLLDKSLNKSDSIVNILL